MSGPFPVTGSFKTTYVTSDGASLIVVDSAGKASRWDVTDPAHPVRVADVTLRTDVFGEVKFSSDGRRVATTGGSERRTLAVGEVAAGGRTRAIA